MDSRSKHCGNDNRWVVLFAVALTVVLSLPIFSQPMTSDLWISRNHEWMLDLGAGWEINSLFQPMQSMSFEQYYGMSRQTPKFWPAKDLAEYWKNVSGIREKNPKSMLVQSRIGFLGRASDGSPAALKDNFGSLYWIAQADYRNFFAETYVRASSDPAALPHFTGHSREIRRIGMNSAEFDHASIGYRNDWLTVVYGRGRQVWGPFGSENLALSDRSAAYDHVSAQFRYKSITGAFFTGFLESVPDEKSVQIRYIAGHGLQYSNRRNFLISLSEITVYSGPNRRFDWTYLNPITPHLDTELNDRENLPYSVNNASNAVWVASLDWMLRYKFRLSASYLLDEFQFDKKDLDQGRPNATALRIRLSKSFWTGRSAWMFHTAYSRVGTYTFRHGSGYSSFTSRGLPLGIPEGSDFYSTTSGITWIPALRIRIDATYNFIRGGENNLLNHLYESYILFTSVPFPSGVNTIQKETEIRLLYSVRPNIEIEIGYNMKHIKIKEKNDDARRIYLQLNCHAPWVGAF
jgi:hypothetical protein